MTIPPQYRVTYKPRRKPFPLLPVALVAAVLLLACVVGVLYLRGPIKPAQDDGRASVEAWLSENLDSGEWEEVRFWPAVAWNNDEGFQIGESPPFRLARMKYRTANQLGAITLRDDYFAIKDGAVIYRMEHRTSPLNRYFTTPQR